MDEFQSYPILLAANKSRIKDTHMKKISTFLLPRVKNWFLFSLALGVFGWPNIGSNFVIAADADAPTKETRPNIVLIMADDLGYECITANGGTSYKTPILDEMARTGIRFNHCYAQPICTPSRVKLMTGIYNVRNYEKFGNLPTSQKTFANVFQNAGYKTCIVGKWQLGKAPHLPKHFGFDEHCLWHFSRRAERFPNPGLDVNGKAIDYSNGEYGPDVVSDYACDFIERNKSEPFLLYYPMILTHCPFCPTPDSADWDPTSKGSPTYKGDPKYFGDMVNYMDKTIGKVLAKLDEVGVRENTLVMFIGDNGTDAPIVSNMGDQEIVGSKGQTIDWGTHVPFIASWPKTIQPSVNDDLITFTDFFSTMCEAASLDIPTEATRDGVSFLPQLKGENTKPRDWIYCFYARDGGTSGKEFIRNQRYKLYRSGEFFNVVNDVREEKPLSLESLDTAQKKVHAKFSTAFESQFKNARPAAVAKIGEELNRKKQEAKKKKANKKKAG